MSRKISNSAAAAFYDGRSFKSGNTTVVIEGDSTNLYLHGNLIAKKERSAVHITNAGWFSNTTKERLNALDGVSICQQKGKWYLNGTEWNGQLTKIN